VLGLISSLERERDWKDVVDDDDEHMSKKPYV
jgi:hypothetical protein